jgi:nucleotide-binding universal stress UspA family protein
MIQKGNNILVPIDFEQQSDFALDLAITLAQTIKLKIVLLYVHEERNMFSKLFDKEQEKLFMKMIEDKLDNMSKSKAETHGIDVEYVILKGSVHEEIVKYAKDSISELIIMGKGSRYIGTDENHEILGSNTGRIVRYSETPVITVGNPFHAKRIRSIMLPLDLSKETRQKVNWGIRMAKLFNAEIKVVSALWDKKNEYVVRTLNSQMDQVVKFIMKEGVKVTGEIIESDAEHKTLVPILMNYERQHEEIDLIIIMTQQENAITHFFMGSHATEYIRQSEPPVMTVIPEQLELYYIQ